MAETAPEDWQAIFVEQDEDADTLITADQLIRAAQLCGYNPDEDEVKSQFEDRQINFEEFCQFMNAQPDAKAELRKAFQEFDHNGDGFIDAHELKRILLDSKHDVEEGEVEETLALFDLNADGKLSCEEFIEFLSANEEVHQEHSKKKKRKKKKKEDGGSDSGSGSGSSSDSD